MNYETHIEGVMSAEDVRTILINDLIKNGFKNPTITFCVEAMYDPCDTFGEEPPTYKLEHVTFKADSRDYI
jgi:hypothetical protein